MGVAVSRGIAQGKVLTLFGHQTPQRSRSINQAEVVTEVERFRTALGAAKAKLQALSERSPSSINDSPASIFDTQILMVEDPSLHQDVVDLIKKDLVSAETAVTKIFEQIVSRGQIDRNRPDIEDIAERLLIELGSGTAQPIGDVAGAIIAAVDLRPSVVADLIANGAAAFIATNGGWTSHSSILMREAGTPAVVGIDRIRSRFNDGDIVRVNGFSGEVAIRPGAVGTHASEGIKAAATVSAAALQTLDGKAITIRANADGVEGWLAASKLDADGVGLFRTESLVGSNRKIPSEDEQVRAYSALARETGGRIVCIRTFDLTLRDVADIGSATEKNPALGVRGVRLGIVLEDILRTQLRAILRASHDANLRIAVPMITGVADIDIVRRFIAEESERLRSKRVPVGHPPFGVMIEVPSAVLMVEEIARAADFLCLGTNDLVQYLVAADRDNASVSRWFRSLHPAVIRATTLVIDAAARQNKPLILCGEMAGSPYYVPVLIGLGATELSMNPGSIENVIRVVAGIAYEEARELVQLIAKCTTADEVEAILNSTIQTKWQHLYPERFLELHGRP